MATTQPEYYVIRVKGHLDPRWSQWFEGMAISHADGGETIISGPLADQAALHGLLGRVADLNMTLLSVQRLDHGAVI